MQETEHWKCGAARAMDILGGKWKLNIIWAIAKNDKLRFNQMKREVKGLRTSC